MIGFRFDAFIPKENNETPFERLLKIFLELMTHTSGDYEESFRWLKELDEEHGLTTPEYTLEDFRKELEEKKLVQKGSGSDMELSAKSEQLIRKKALEQIFGKLKKYMTENGGNHEGYFESQPIDSIFNENTFKFDYIKH